MLLSSNSRYFLRHEVAFKPYRDKGAGLSLISDDGTVDVLSVLQDALKADQATFVINKHDVVRLTAIEHLPKQEMVVLLFRRSDPDLAAPVFENRKTRALRLSDKGEDDAEAVSAHLFLSTRPAFTPNPTYRAILEEVPGLGRTYVQAIMKQVLRDRPYEYEDDRGQAKNTYSVVVFGGVPSETLGQAIRRGGIKYIELVRAPRLDGLDTAGLVAHAERLKLSVKESDRGNLDIIRRVRGWANAHEWRDLRVQIATGDDRTRVVEVAREADAADVLFVKSELMTDIKPPLLQCTEKVHNTLSLRAADVLNSDAGWRNG